ncbi:MAG: MFS transporter [Pseudomonadota bacterium]
MTTISNFKVRYSWLRATVITNFFLGFSGGLPFPLVYATLTAWLEEAGLARSTISTFAWIGFAYSLKFLWAPIIDSTRVPLLTRWFGRRRAWLLVAQLGIALSLLALSTMDPALELPIFTLVVLAVALFSATQDIVIDAYRVESDDLKMQGLLAAAYQYGYRLALIFSMAGALYIAEWGSWSLAYQAMAGLMCVGVMTVLLSPEPTSITPQASHSVGEWLATNVAKPFTDFFKRCGWIAIPIIAYILCFRVSDYVLGILANPFYLDLGFSKSEVASVAKLYGVVVALIGVAVGGVAVLKAGIYRSLILASILIASTNLAFMFLAFQGPELWALAVTISGDNFAMGFAGTVFIAYLSSLTNTEFTATQYALFSSISVLLGKFVAKYSGNVQEWSGWATLASPWMTDAARDADWAGWVGFFLYASLTGVPSILLAIFVSMKRFRPPDPAPGPVAADGEQPV